MINRKSVPTVVAFAVVGAALMACGGGGGDSAAPPLVPESPSGATLSNIAAQGIWQSAAGADMVNSTLVTDDGQVWSILTTASTTRLLKASLARAASGFTGTGKSFVLGTTAAEGVNMSVSAVAKTSLSGNISNATQSESYSLAYQTRYDVSATLASFVGNWGATLGPGAVSLTIGSTGAIAGTRTTGCTYVGQLSLRTEGRAVVDVAMTETCPAVTQMAGVAVKTNDNKGITMLMTTVCDAQAVVLALR